MPIIENDARRLIAPSWGSVYRAGPATWRVLDRRGRVRGHLTIKSTPRGDRYCVARFHSASRSFLTVGEFWSADEAFECIRYLR